MLLQHWLLLGHHLSWDTVFYSNVVFHLYCISVGQFRKLPLIKTKPTNKEKNLTKPPKPQYTSSLLQLRIFMIFLKLHSCIVSSHTCTFPAVGSAADTPHCSTLPSPNACRRLYRFACWQIMSLPPWIPLADTGRYSTWIRPPRYCI